MIHSLRFSNFFSFADETEVSFVLDARCSNNESSVTSAATGKNISKVLAVIGANGAGKTNVIKALDFVLWFISKSFYSGADDHELAIVPFMYQKKSPIHFELEFEISNNLYRYILDVTDTRVEFESLQMKTSRLFSTFYSRKWNESTNKNDITQRGFGLPKTQEQKLKPFASMISTADQFGVEVAQIICKACSQHRSNINSIGRRDFQGAKDVMAAASFYNDNAELRSRMVELLNQWDLGLKDIKFEKIPSLKKDKEEELLFPFGVHSDGNRDFVLPFFAESSGTQAAFVLLSRLLPVLSEGGTMIYDELESDLHPLMLEPILNLFVNTKTNPNNAQIIFTCHSLEILNLLKKGQILLVEKNERCRSEAWRLSDMEGVRADDNFYAKYMAGTYGAVPVM